MPDISAIPGTVSALKGAMDITKAMIDLRDGQAMQTKIIELNSKSLEAQSSAFTANDERTTLIEKVRALEQEIIQLKAWDAEKEKYHLQAVMPGSFAYVRKAEAQPAEPNHWLCTACYGKGKKSFLQRTGPLSGVAANTYKCFACNEQIVVPYTVNPQS